MPAIVLVIPLRKSAFLLLPPRGCAAKSKDGHSYGGSRYLYSSAVASPHCTGAQGETPSTEPTNTHEETTNNETWRNFPSTANIRNTKNKPNSTVFESIIESCESSPKPVVTFRLGSGDSASSFRLEKVSSNSSHIDKVKEDAAG